ncbi:zinc finger MYND domain-containing protein [Chlamydiales bacterium]|nr:zinc finger MYND domain-containing protein [Chlamydiales bacterium]
MGRIKYCESCSTLEEEIKYKKCGNCRVVHYCSDKCQKTDWKIHKKACESFKHRTHCAVSSRGIQVFHRFSKETISIDLADAKSMQSALNRQDFVQIFDAVNAYHPKRDELKNIRQIIGFIETFVNQNHPYIFHIMTKLLGDKFRLEKHKFSVVEKRNELADIANYMLLARFHCRLADCCCDDKGLNEVVKNLDHIFKQQEVVEKFEGLIPFFKPQLTDHLNKLNVDDLPSPQWLANFSRVHVPGHHGLQPANRWADKRAEIIQALTYKLSSSNPLQD